MGKRSNFVRRERDFYPTPPEAVQPLLPHLPANTAFIEPCAGDGALVRALESAGHRCVYRFDLEPQAPGIARRDALCQSYGRGGVLITNPPWRFDFVDALVTNAAASNVVWLLLSADFAHNKRSARLLRMCTDIVSVGRVKWIPGSRYAGKDNAAWYRFCSAADITRFHSRRD